MLNYTLQKKRDGQSWENDGYIYAATFEDATKIFSNNVYNDLLSGVYGDNYIEQSEQESGEEEAGIYYYGELEFSEHDKANGIESYSNDVYMYRVLIDLPF